MEKVRIGIIVAMDVEMEKIEAAMENAKKSKVAGMIFIRGTLFGIPVVAARSGVGKVSAAMCTQAMIDRYHPEQILGAGIAGGLKDLKPGGVAVGRDMVQHDFVLNAFGYPDGYLPSVGTIFMQCDPDMVRKLTRAAQLLKVPYAVGTIASGDCFVNTTEKKNYIVSTFHAIACEMEGAAIAQVCTLNQLPFCVIRCISDSGDESADTDIEVNEAISTAGSAALVLKYAELLAGEAEKA